MDSCMMKIVEDLTLTNRVFCSKGYDEVIEYLRKLLPFEVNGYEGCSCNGWVIPPSWDLKEAKIFHDGRLVWDGMSHPLAVIALSSPFRGKVSKAELLEHLYFDARYDHVIPYHFRQLYRPWKRSWGFCLPRKLYDSLPEGDYDVVIETIESSGCLKVPEFTIQGRSDLCFAFVAHLDHPGMANDDLCGCAVGVELFRRLSRMKTNYSYKLLLVQEMTGSEFYWNFSNPKNKNKIFEGLFIEMLGSKTGLVYQQSQLGASNIEWALTKALEDLKLPFRKEPFRGAVCNDENIWEAYGVPMASISRFPYPEYHCDLDNPSIISQEMMGEALDTLLRTVTLLDSSAMVSKRFKGTICLSNPDYNLYMDPGQPAYGEEGDENATRWNKLMEAIPLLSAPVCGKRLASEFGLPEKSVMDYLARWKEKGLLDISFMDDSLSNSCVDHPSETHKCKCSH
ncbi:MAG: hypothetical protein A2X49_05525 [Lentisphaerae bacterium GWF2_52_8]|nr:MAG: hypothetical protein A2X49_05525 [Lentisphaerae bacterium GWF2_52_8]